MWKWFLFSFCIAVSDGLTASSLEMHEEVTSFRRLCSLQMCGKKETIEFEKTTVLSDYLLCRIVIVVMEHQSPQTP